MQNIRLSTLIATLTLLGACSKAPVQTEVSSGLLEGYLDGGVEHYLGVPYAAPPTGDLRWRSPKLAEPWQGVREAKELSSNCPQFIPGLNSVTGNEDCLYLSVWTPAEKPEQAMPVMVWIHGGGFIAGQGSMTPGDGSRLAADNDVVVVALNYRLGVFGFMAHDKLISEEPDNPGAGNYGIGDQTAALRWVQRNISAFGGDPNRVMIFGQSAGAVSICAQLASPLAAGLFHGAVIQSGPCDTPMSTLAAVSQLGGQVAAGLGCREDESVLTCMRDKTTEQVAEVLPPDPTFAFGEGYTHWWPNQDGHVLPLQMREAFATGRFNRVPVINGATRDEATLLIWLSHNMLMKPLQAKQYMARLEYLVGTRELAERVAQKYPLENYPSPFDALTAAFSDGFFNCMARSQSTYLSRHVPTWGYQFDYDQAPFFIPWAELGAYHSAEIQYIFGRPMTLGGGDFEGEQADLARAMMGYWVQFARTGNPNGPGLAPWPAYREENDEIMLFDRKNSVASDIHREDCRFWESLPYLRAAYSESAEDR